jgi:aldehyde:ferredoxin oxidoreductase
VVSGAMDLEEKGFLKGFPDAPRFGDAASMIAMLKSLAYGSSELGRLFAAHSDEVIAGVSAANPGADREAVARCVTTAYAGLGYAGIEPKAFPGMFTAYSTSNRGRGDHTYAWTIQAEEGGLSGAGELAAYVGGGQVGKALVDSKGLCDFFCEDNTSELFLKLYHALTGFEYTTESMKTCGARIYNLERRVNNTLGRTRVYDAYIPPKLTVPMTGGAHRGRAVNSAYHNEILDAYYDHWGWTRDGIVPDEKLRALGVPVASASGPGVSTSSGSGSSGSG